MIKALASSLRMAFVAGVALLAGAGMAAAQSNLTIRTAPDGPQDSGTPPTFQRYPLWDRLFGPGGAIFPGYVAPIDNRRDTQLALLTGGGAGGLVFAAGTADARCQPAQAPQITVLRAPPGVAFTTDYGPFRVVSNDAGSTYCLGRNIRGTRLFVAGKLPRAGGTATVRVAYPRVGRSGRTYTHVVNIPSR